MNVIPIMIHGLLLGGLASICTAQEQIEGKPGQERVVAPQQEETGGPDAAEVQRLIGQLGNPSYQVRKDAEEKLRKAGAKAQDALSKAAETHRDQEVRWRARRLVQQLEMGPQEEASPGSAGRRLQPLRQRFEQPRRVIEGIEGLDTIFDRVFEQLERDFQIDVPRRTFFSDPFFRDLKEQMQDLRARAQGQFFGLPGQSQSMQFQMGPEGVRVEVRSKDEDGKEQTRVYEAPDLQTLRSQHPEVFDRATGPLGGFHFGVPPALRRLELRPPGAPLPGGLDVSVGDASERLGVTVREEISEDLRDFLGLKPGVGLMIEEVLPDALGANLGLKRGDVVLSVAGRPVGAPEDVRQALMSVAHGGMVLVDINRRGSELQLSAPRPAQTSGRTLQERKQGGQTGQGEPETEVRKSGEQGRLRVR